MFERKNSLWRFWSCSYGGPPSSRELYGGGRVVSSCCWRGANELFLMEGQGATSRGEQHRERGESLRFFPGLPPRWRISLSHATEFYASVLSGEEIRRVLCGKRCEVAKKSGVF